jgi:diguanylate cyclase (GGDEF)-like protein
MIIADTLQMDTWFMKDEAIRSYLGAPIQIKGHTLGFINQTHREPNYYTMEHAERLQTFADLAAIALENAHLFSLTQEMAVLDELTGLNNRRNFFQLASNEVIRSKRYEKTCCLVIFDIDHFKEINDDYGHPAGDNALKETAAILVEHIREIDISGRYGGDEFCMLLPETDLNEARITILRLMNAFRNHPLTSAGINRAITVSFGVADLDKDIKSLDELIARADRALYSAKHNGRDRIEVWTREQI